MFSASIEKEHWTDCFKVTEQKAIGKFHIVKHIMHLYYTTS